MKCKCCDCQTDNEDYCSAQCEVSDLEHQLAKPRKYDDIE